MGYRDALRRGLIGGTLLIGLAGCVGGFGAGGAVPNVPPDSRGVITYATYQVAVARDGDSLDSVAARVGGVSAAELSRLNGLPLDYRLRQGEVLALPDSVPRGAPMGTSGAPTGWTPEIATQAIDAAPGAGTPPPVDNPFGNGQTDLVIDPIRHRVEPGETAYSIARLYGVSVTALASWNGLGPDLAVRANQELLIPVVSGANQIQSGLPDTFPGQGTPASPPPSAAAPLPTNIDVAAGAAPDSPNLSQYRTPPGGRLAPPVDGPVTKPYNLAPGPNRSEGIGYGVAAGTPVRAAGTGEVALISESLGDLGTIVIIRHPDDVMTVYGRVSDVTVERGQTVTQGQRIGSVASGPNPELHFEVRRGTESVDPAAYLGG
jgi:murein DD-endopeptidase MepM/ murein hydrolase activator NlpD